MDVNYSLFKNRYWFAPFGKSLGIKNTRSKKAIPNEILEKAYLSKKTKYKQVSKKFILYVTKFNLHNQFYIKFILVTIIISSLLYVLYGKIIYIYIHK